MMVGNVDVMNKINMLEAKLNREDKIKNDLRERVKTLKSLN